MLKFRLSEFLDKLILLLAMIIFLLVGISSIRSVRKLDVLSRQDAPMLSQSKVDAPIYSVDPIVEKSATWSRPRSQSRGEDWIFDVFTPPVLYYNPNSREFTVTPPERIASSGQDPWKLFEIELLEVRQRPYRLQLVGYAGDDDNYLAYLQYIPTGKLHHAKQGDSLMEAGVKILSFEVKQMEVEKEGSMPVYQKVGVARLLDYESGEEIYLTNLETKIFSDLEAKIRDVQDGEVYVVREGSQVELNNGFYIIGDLSADPQEAMVTKVSVDGGRRLSKLLKAMNSAQMLNQGTIHQNPTSPFAIRPRSIPRKPNS